MLSFGRGKGSVEHHIEALEDVGSDLEKHLLYLEEGQEGKGCFLGRLADFFGLKGRVATKETFRKLAEGKDPRSGNAIVRHRISKSLGGKDEHFGFIDGVFSPPKSVSSAALAGGDFRLVEAHMKAVSRAMEEVERHAWVAKGERKGGKAGRFFRRDEKAEGLIWTEFLHFSARAVDGFAAPQLHTHVCIFNVGKGKRNRQGKEFYALNRRKIMEAAGLAGAIYQSELARECLDLGYKVEYREPTSAERMSALGRLDERKFEIAGFTKEYLEANSPRSKQRAEALKAKGLPYSWDAAQREIYRLRSRKDIGHLDNFELWRERDEALGGEAERIVADAAKRGRLAVSRPVSAKDAVDYALESGLERNSFMPVTDIERKAIFRGLFSQGVTIENVRQTIEGLGRDAVRFNLNGKEYVTTQKAIEREKETLRAVEKGKGKFEPTQAKPEFFEGLSVAQTKAAQTLLESGDQIIGLQGAAGAGKSTLLKSVKKAFEESGFELVWAAPTGTAAENLAELGTPKTLQSLLIERAERDRQGFGGRVFDKLASAIGAKKSKVVVVDEAGMIGTKDMHALVQSLESHERLLLIGDVGQHGAVSAGAPFRQMQQAGMLCAELNEIHRQENPKLRQIVTELHRGNAEALQQLRGLRYADGRQALVEIQDDKERERKFIGEFLRDPNHTQAYATTNTARERLNKAIHAALGEAGKLSGREIEVTILKAVDLTTAQKMNCGSFSVGDVIVFGMKCGVFTKGDTAVCVEIDAGKDLVFLETEGRGRIGLRPDQAPGIEIRRPEKKRYQAGELIQFTRKVETPGGTVPRRKLARVESVDESGATLTVGKRRFQVAADVLRFTDYAYCMTSYSGQSVTVPVSLVWDDSPHDAAAKNYVGLSRAKNSATLFTANLSATITAIRADKPDLTAIEAVDLAARERQRAEAQEIRRAERAAELTKFKSADLVEYACRQGFKVSQQHAKAIFMSHSDGSHCYVGKLDSGRYVFDGEDAGGKREHGTIMDFVQWRTGNPIPAIRRELREFIAEGISSGYDIQPSRRGELSFFASEDRRFTREAARIAEELAKRFQELCRRPEIKNHITRFPEPGRPFAVIRQSVHQWRESDSVRDRLAENLNALVIIESSGFGRPGNSAAVRELISVAQEAFIKTGIYHRPDGPDRACLEWDNEPRSESTKYVDLHGRSVAARAPEWQHQHQHDIGFDMDL